MRFNGSVSSIPPEPVYARFDTAKRTQKFSELWSARYLIVHDNNFHFKPVLPLFCFSRFLCVWCVSPVRLLRQDWQELHTCGRVGSSGCLYHSAR